MQRSGNTVAPPRPLPLVLAVVIIVAIAAVSWRRGSSDGGNIGGGERANSPAAQTSAEVSKEDKTGETPTQAVADTDGRGAFFGATKVHRNSDGGYSFRYPAGWDLTKTGSVTRLARPDGHFAVSFGLGPVGGLPVAYDEFVSLLDDSYNNVVLGKVDATKVQKNVGVLVKGEATTRAGVRVRFLAAVIGRTTARRAIGALAATDSESVKFQPAILKILKSFRPA